MLNKELLLTSNSAKPTVTFEIHKGELAQDKDVFSAEISYNGQPYYLMVGFGVGISHSITAPYTGESFIADISPYLQKVSPSTLTYKYANYNYYFTGLNPFDHVVLTVQS